MIFRMMSWKIKQRMKEWKYTLYNSKLPIRPVWVMWAFGWMAISFLIFSFSVGGDRSITSWLQREMIWTGLVLVTAILPGLTKRIVVNLNYKFQVRNEQKKKRPNEIKTVLIAPSTRRRVTIKSKQPKR
jgi:hypothetical protein